MERLANLFYRYFSGCKYYFITPFCIFWVVIMSNRVWSGYMDGYLKKNLSMGMKVIKKDWDMCIIVDGYEGSGKSVLAQQCASFVDTTFNIERICFTPKEFVTQINKAQKYSAVIYDEAYGGMSSRAAMSEVNRSLMSVLAEIRQKNLWVFIVLPCFFELDKYASVWRSRALLHVYTGKDYERGRFGFYSQQGKKLLYVLGKKFFSYARPTPNFIGRFTNGYTVDEALYRKKKVEALKEREDKPRGNSYATRLEAENEQFVKELRLLGYTWDRIGELVGKHRTTIIKRYQKDDSPKEMKGVSEYEGSTITNLPKGRIK